jgi:hypothetical protein
MKKIVCTLLLLCICLSLTGCVHEHTAHPLWSIEIENHRHTCQRCGKELDSAPHSFGDDGVCTVCGAVFSETDSGKEVKLYDDHGALVMHITYDNKGKMLSDDRYTYEYHEDGNVKTEKYYKDRKILWEYEFRHCENPANGATYKAASTEYTDFSSTYSEYTEDQRILSATTYDVNGEVFAVERYEYEFDAEGTLIRTSLYTDDQLVRIYDHAGGKLFEYDPNGKVKLERSYVYDEDGNIVKEVVKVYDRLDHESYYTTGDDGYYVFKTIIYNENGEVDKEVHYDANGKEIK